ncbi:hypothetical protein SK128_024688 [Halocaridina rubra]|uniref:Uncharacterized protein n=1 Tax=Halocaridina rubra TaxID=373956 RepID=A0AAN8WWB2_HALRR
MALSANSYPPSQEKLYYFTGKVRAFWKDKIFLLDHHNAAVVGIEDLYLDGKKASAEDLGYIKMEVANRDWESAPEFRSYVLRFTSCVPPPWPYKMQGKKLWLARCAWTGTMPKLLKTQLSGMNVQYLPLALYTGKILNVFNDKLLFGNDRNQVTVHFGDFYQFGQKADYHRALNNLNDHVPLIHSFVCRLSYFTNVNYHGPKPRLPTSVMHESYPSTWVAKFAWQGEMPEDVKQELCRYTLVRLNEWDDDNLFVGNVPPPLHMNPLYCPVSPAGVGEGLPNGVEIPKPAMATLNEPYSVRGALLLANHEYGLMNSFSKIIVFSIKNLYVYGNIFDDRLTLIDFVKKKKLPLTAYIVPLPEPIIVFNIHVKWRAVYTWYGMPPRDMDAIMYRYTRGMIAGTIPEGLYEKNIPNFTLVIGEILDVCSDGGLAKAKLENETITISFKSKAIYMYGSNVHPSRNLQALKPDLFNDLWTFLVHPVTIDDHNVKYAALALWQYRYQHFVCVNLYHKIQGEGKYFLQEYTTHDADHTNTSTDDKYMIGLLVKTTSNYGIIEAGIAGPELVYVYFKRHNFYIDGEQQSEEEFLYSMGRYRWCHFISRPITFQKIDGYAISLEAIMVWVGTKPILGNTSSPKEPSMPLLDEVLFATPVHDSESATKNYSQAGSNKQNSLQSFTPKSLPTSEHKAGFFVFLSESIGVVKCGNRNAANSDYVLFEISILWVDRELVGDRDVLANVIDDNVQCNLIAYAIPVVEVGGFPVNMQATSVWLGKKPSQIKIPTGKDLRAPETSGKTNAVDNSGCISSSADLKSSKESDGSIKGATLKGDISLEVGKKLSQVSLIGSESKTNAKTENVSVEKIFTDPKNPYVGKQISARIMTWVGDTGLAKWRSSTLDGIVYIKFNLKNLYVNLCPVKDHIAAVAGQVANFYVIPTEHKVIEGYTVNLSATCGWIGAKPHCIPAPGKQPHAQLCFENLHMIKYNIGRQISASVVKILKHTGIARWRSSAMGGDVYVEFDMWDCCRNLRSHCNKIENTEDNSQTANFYVIPIPHKEISGFTISLSATFGWMGSKPTHYPNPAPENQLELEKSQLHIMPVHPTKLPQNHPHNALQLAITNKSQDNTLDFHKRNGTKPKEKNIKNLDEVNVTESYNNKMTLKGEGRKKNKNEVWDDENEKMDVEGTIIEIFSNNGRLQGPDGTQHFFSRENCYLYGVNLSNVELWHVLINNEKVHFKLDEIYPGVSKVSKMWIGPEKIENVSKAVALINEWCKKNLVPDGAREILVCHSQFLI